MDFLARAIRIVEDSILVGVLGGMILLGALQILLRNVGGDGFAWGDPLLRVMVLWAALVGAMVAARDDSHVRIDVLRQFLPAAARPWLDRLMRCATALVSFLMAWASARFVADERELGLVAFADIPVWWCESIIPIAFAVLGLRYAILVFVPPPEPATAAVAARVDEASS